MADSPDLNKVLRSIKDMPALPNVVARLTRLIGDPRTTAADINKVLSSDPALVTRILKLVNSSYYGFSRRITTITNAVVILGFNQVRNLALSAFIYDTFAKLPGNDRSFDVNSFWRHCIGAAFMAAGLARATAPKMEEDAFICGLLHDLGKFIMAQNAPDHMAMVMETVNSEDILFYEAEQKRLNYTHAVLGGAVMERWNLPATLVDVVANHHTPMKAPKASRSLAVVTNAADILARALLMGNPGDTRIPRLTSEVWSATGLDWERLEGIIHKVAEDYSKSDAFFSMQ